ncbi:MAG: nuclear transport factor 2 family protein [Myxococcota bacterium]
MSRDPLDPANARTAIENLMFTYAERIDAGDLDGVAALFEHGRIVDAEGQLQGEGVVGVRAIYEAATKIHADGTPMTQHVTSNLILEFADDMRSARVRSRCTVLQAVPPDFPLQPIITNDYEDAFAWDASRGWHFVERKMIPKRLGDLSQHLKYDLARVMPDPEA